MTGAASLIDMFGLSPKTSQSFPEAPWTASRDNERVSNLIGRISTLGRLSGGARHGGHRSLPLGAGVGVGVGVRQLPSAKLFNDFTQLPTLGEIGWGT